MFKREGRIGDSAVIGAGTFADDSAGAASCTGAGEVIIRFGLAKAAVDLLRDGCAPQLAAEHVIHALTRRFGSEAGIILIDRFGRTGVAHNTPYMAFARAGEPVAITG
jgi:beta-aspartyl-peptidase (threonine type)